jgi:hypothetical protein
MKIASCLLAFVIGWPLLAQQTRVRGGNALARSADTKLHHIETNAQGSPPDAAPTVLTEDEINAYLSSGAMQLPKGVQRVRMEGSPGVVVANCRVDFDQLTAGARSANPLLALFSGVHDVQTAAHARGERGQGYVHVDRVSIDGAEVPRTALEFFVQHYLRPKYPEIGLDTRFQMPDRVDTAVVGSHQLTVVQR